MIPSYMIQKLLIHVNFVNLTVDVVNDWDERVTTEPETVLYTFMFVVFDSLTNVLMKMN